MAMPRQPELSPFTQAERDLIRLELMPRFGRKRQLTAAYLVGQCPGIIAAA